MDKLVSRTVFCHASAQKIGLVIQQMIKPVTCIQWCNIGYRPPTQYDLEFIGKKRSRIRKLPYNWRVQNFNPAQIPSAWKPVGWDEKQKLAQNYERQAELAKYIPGYQPNFPPDMHDHYHKEPLHHFHVEGQLHEGFKQIMVVTKSVLMPHGMPDKVKQLTGSMTSSELDGQVMQAIQHSRLFDMDPRNFCRNNSRKIYKQDNFDVYNSPERYCPLLVKELIRLSNVKACQLSDNYFDRCDVPNVTTVATFDRECTSMANVELVGFTNKYRIGLQGKSTVAAMGKSPLEPFAGREEVEKSVDTPLPDLHPITPISDMKKTNIYEIKNSTGILPTFPKPHLHTAVICNVDQTPCSHMTYCRMLYYLFSSLYSRALELYGDEPQALPEPLVAQAIGTDGRTFQTMALQLNTTALQSDDGIKNMVWIEYEGPVFESSPTAQSTGMPMYERCNHDLRYEPTYLTGYDPQVFGLFQAVWLNGVL